MVERDLLFPWLQPADVARELEVVVPIDVWAEQVGLGDELIDAVLWGLPTIPPALGEKCARVSVQHARYWELATRALIRTAGGNWRTGDLGGELRRLAGVAVAGSA